MTDKKGVNNNEMEPNIDEEWNLEEEVTKIIETGTALGFDFLVNEMEITEFVTAKEREDKETKLNVFDRKIIRNIGGNLLSQGVGVEAIGSAGGLITLWNENMVTVTDLVEGMSALFRKAAEKGMVKGVVVGGEAIHVTHLQFADDTMLFLQLKEEYLSNARRILRCFETASGLKLNFSKSCVVRVGHEGESEVD
ncbi:hypothetical protein Dsin_003706 [Dipteronia sinensis]|uniref:Reverse transcriptase domain-containing protein n=1 Tax=Dipteronia sinensis TaxID=43782 RepID=A0AAE0B9H7_9ROSI|nr:hypothetical protein Dsin_003706 [Dipteronia sinensis]